MLKRLRSHSFSAPQVAKEKIQICDHLFHLLACPECPLNSLDLKLLVVSFLIIFMIKS
ncbi:MAG: hypothetical protein OJF59_000816 [Cytophagales bacterium]|nr:MAG: hypothetical protein OJF59_000816 [Cytophagales bacterium]